jgi:GT2 family glycosyltransferase
MNKLITACIVLYENDRKMLLESINSFLNTELNIELYLIDHSPTNQLKDIIQHEKVIYIHNSINPGFGSGHNNAIEKIIEISDYHLILNPDVYFEKGTLEMICDFMDMNLNIGQLMPKVTYPNGEIQYLCKTNPTFFDLFARGFLPNFIKNIFKKRIDSYEYKNHNYEEMIYDIPYLSGCFMFLRTETLKKVGFFDDNIFMYLEDADITRRFLQVSRTVYFPHVSVFHHYAGLTHKKWKYKWITIQSAFIYFNKWGWFNSLY